MNNNVRTSGIALVTALSVMVVVGILVAGSYLVTQMELSITRNDATSLQARYVATAGVEKYKAALFQYFRYVEDYFTSRANPPRTACYSRMGAGLDWDRNGTVETAWSSNRITFPPEPVYDADGTTRIGEYTVSIMRDPSNNKVYTIEARGNSNGARATVRSTVLLDNTGVLEQAIFSGSGQANKFINGGTTIRGGIYVVGDETQPDDTVFHSNGNFALLNEYDLTDTGRYGDMYLRVTEANRTADELCANLRVMDGRVELNGSVQLGTPDNTLLGVYIGDDIDSDLIINTTLLTCTETKGVCADDGPSAFDITREFAPRFPTLDSPPNEASDCDLSTWRACVHADSADHGLVISRSSGVIVPPGATFSDSPSCNAFIADGLATGVLTFGNDPINCLASGGGRTFGFKYTPGSIAKLEIYGPIDFRGFNVVINKDLEYYAQTTTGGTTVRNSAITVEKEGGQGGDLDIYGRFLTGVTGAPGFPEHVLALVVENDVYQGASQVMAPIYSGGTYRTGSNNILIGSVVTDYFCTTKAGKNDSKNSSDKCNAGQNSEVVYVNTGNNKPDIMRYVDFAGFPVFQVLSTEVR
ncbi:MAG TPA: pilus assembly PilX N-terminal domain-containing protein [Trueperaceae bacterium]